MTGLQAQRDFAARIRQPDVHPLPDGVPAGRMAIYEQLFFNTIEGFLSSGFPVSQSSPLGTSIARIGICRELIIRMISAAS